MVAADGFPDAALEDIAYLALSESRLRILDSIAAESHTRGEVAEATGIARTTIDRIINELEERGWAQRTADGDYEATAVGERVVTEFRPFVGTMEAIRKLGEMVAWLPTDVVSIGLHHFTDATIRRPDPANPTAVATYFTDLFRGISDFHCLVGVAPPPALEKEMRDGVVTRDLSTEHVITAEELNYLRDHPERLPRWREYLDAGANVYLHDGPIPCNLFVMDETVIIGNSQSEVGPDLAIIESTNEAIRSWVLKTIERYREDAERLDASSFTRDATDATDNDRC